jgi:hypothetical protein
MHCVSFSSSNRLLKKSLEWFDKLTTNGSRKTISMSVPFALSPSKGIPVIIFKALYSILSINEFYAINAERMVNANVMIRNSL